jgi:hypothetical protein
MNNRFSRKKHGTVKVYLRPEIDKEPWLRKLAGRTEKQILRWVRQDIAKRLKLRIKDILFERYKDGWILLHYNQRIVWQPKNSKTVGGWHPAEEWAVEHHQLHGEHPGYDE